MTTTEHPALTAARDAVRVEAGRAIWSAIDGDEPTSELFDVKLTELIRIAQLVGRAGLAREFNCDNSERKAGEWQGCSCGFCGLVSQAEAALAVP